MARFFSACHHVGQTVALLGVAAALKAAGHTINIALQQQGPAANSYEEGARGGVSEVYRLFRLLELAPTFVSCDSEESLLSLFEYAGGADAVLITLSPADNVNLEVETLSFARNVRVCKPVYGYVEVPCGHMATLWRDRLKLFNGLFVAKMTPDLRELFGDRVWEVGPQLDALRIDRQERGSQTKAKLKMGVDDPFVWYTGGPYPEAVDVLRHVAEIMTGIRSTHRDRFHNLTLVVTRHNRDRKHPRAEDISHEYWGAMDAARNEGLIVLENSPDHRDMGWQSRYSVTDVVSYFDLLCALHYGGIVVAGQGTEALVRAPHCGYPSILCNTSDEFDPTMVSEKGARRFPLQPGCPPQVGTPDELANWLRAFLLMPDFRAFYSASCPYHYPWREQGAGELVADRLGKLFLG